MAAGEATFAGAESSALATAASEATALSQPLGTWMSRLVVIAVIVTAVNLRPAVTSIGPVLQEVRRGLGMSSTVPDCSRPCLRCASAFSALARPALNGGSDVAE